jgi:mRNA interferase RelE/StbE
MYQIRILDAAVSELANLDKSVGQRVVNRINWLAANLGNINPETLTGDMVGFYKLRVGDYRVVYEILEDEQTLMIHKIGHRREVYRGR